jgi:hypothetical protein
VQPVGEWVVDGVDIRVGEQFRVPGVRLRDVVLRGEVLGALGIPRRNGDDGHLGGLRRRPDHRRRCDACRAENAQP